ANTIEQVAPQPDDAAATKSNAAAIATAASATVARAAISSSHPKESADRVDADSETPSPLAVSASDIVDGEPNPAAADAADQQPDTDAATDQKAPGAKTHTAQDRPTASAA